MPVISFTLDIARFSCNSTAFLLLYLYAYVTTCNLNKANLSNELTFIWFLCSSVYRSFCFAYMRFRPVYYSIVDHQR